VGVVAAVVSYRHLSGLLAFYGEDTLTATIGPLAVDGLMVMATSALIATSTVATRRPDTAPDIQTDTTPVKSPDNATDTNRPAPRTRQPTPGRTPARTPGRSSRPDTAAAVARLRGRFPDMSSTDMAARLGVSDRTVRRHLAAGHSSAETVEPTAPALHSVTDPQRRAHA
jgi:hypothetical protein